MKADQTEIVILQTGDVHGHVRDATVWGSEESSHGMARISSFVKKEREKDPDLLLFDSGDMLQGSPLAFHYAHFNDYMPNPLISVMNHLAYDGAVIGEHDFDYGLSCVSRAVSRSFFPWLSANVVHKVTKEPYFGFPYTIKNIKGVKIAILGITAYRESGNQPCTVNDVLYEDAFDAVKRWVPFIHETEKPDLVILNYHGGMNDAACDHKSGAVDQGLEIAQSIEGIDVMLTGRQHQLVCKKIHDKWMIQPGAFGHHAGKVSILMTRMGNSWKIEQTSGQLVTMEEYAPDPVIEKLVYFQELEAGRWLNESLMNEIEVSKDIGIKTKVSDWIKKASPEDFIDFF
ncbi:bifunctional metallophosphatase/5'-nucleotidase [Jeotgalibacillus aurantiacus]|uniref:bifunctional metallophosphatase/5'-nucleotidase n=1 Tax=Jeotgalibacillus aurantiacus TaxID=2763266 RepID=UPI001D0B784F|nr:metallophosphoesterase [Jeotgalibacillus aurantiacus]